MVIKKIIIYVNIQEKFLLYMLKMIAKKKELELFF